MRELTRFSGGLEHLPVLCYRGMSRMGLRSRLGFDFTGFVRSELDLNCGTNTKNELTNTGSLFL